VTNTTQVSTDTVNWQPGPNPTISGQNLYWGPESGPPLNTLLSRIRPGETVYLRFDVYASCPFAGGQLRIQTGYRDTCGNPYLTEASYFVMPVRTADLSIVKVGENLSRTSPSPEMIYAEPGEPVVFTITVSNSGSAAPAREVVVTDTLPGNLVFQNATPGYTFSGGPPGGVLTWTFDIITPATSVVLTVTTVVSQPEGCTVDDTYNTAEVSWGCPDGCRQSARSDLVTLRTRPVYDIAHHPHRHPARHPPPVRRPDHRHAGQPGPARLQRHTDRYPALRLCLQRDGLCQHTTLRYGGPGPDRRLHLGRAPHGPDHHRPGGAEQHWSRRLCCSLRLQRHHPHLR